MIRFITAAHSNMGCWIDLDTWHPFWPLQNRVLSEQYVFSNIFFVRKSKSVSYSVLSDPVGIRCF